jgi:hypothetical protein
MVSDVISDAYTEVRVAQREQLAEIDSFVERFIPCVITNGMPKETLAAFSDHVRNEGDHRGIPLDHLDNLCDCLVRLSHRRRKGKRGARRRGMSARRVGALRDIDSRIEPKRILLSCSRSATLVEGYFVVQREDRRVLNGDRHIEGKLNGHPGKVGFKSHICHPAVSLVPDKRK